MTRMADEGGCKTGPPMPTALTMYGAFVVAVAFIVSAYVPANTTTVLLAAAAAFMPFWTVQNGVVKEPLPPSGQSAVVAHICVTVMSALSPAAMSLGCGRWPAR